jgi:hypothetical protein
MPLTCSFVRSFRVRCTKAAGQDGAYVSEGGLEPNAYAPSLSADFRLRGEK